MNKLISQIFCDHKIIQNEVYNTYAYIGSEKQYNYRKDYYLIKN